ncbi:MAG: hypothetical protein J2P22_20590, partial [Nocardioides sp.]|nr:hypothetical protein [Nocardioides sp.]
MAELFGTKRMELRIELHAAGEGDPTPAGPGPYTEDLAPNAQDGWSSFGRLDRLPAPEPAEPAGLVTPGGG